MNLPYNQITRLPNSFVKKTSRSTRKFLFLLYWIKVIESIVIVVVILLLIIHSQKYVLQL